MTSFRTPKRGVSYSEALAAAYASAPDVEPILDTLEFRHPLFVDDDGNPTSVFIVHDHDPLIATLEVDAPLFGGEEVTFQPVQFEFSRPAETESSASPEIAISVDNVARVLVPYLDLARDSKELIHVTWRPYLPSDLTTPHMVPPLTLTVTSVSVNMQSVSLKAGFADLTNRRFPSREYTSKLFPGLSAR